MMKKMASHFSKFPELHVVLFLIVYLLSFPFNCNSQIEFEEQRVYGGLSSDSVFDITETPSIAGANYSVGVTYSQPSNCIDDQLGNGDYWVVSSPDGNWCHTYTFGGTGYDKATVGHFFHGSNRIVGGVSNSDMSAAKSENGYGGLDAWILKFYANFSQILWDKTLGGSGTEKLANILPADEDWIGGDFVCAISSNSDSTGNKTSAKIGGYDYWLVSLDVQDGHIKWQKTMGGKQDDIIANFCYTSDNHFLIIGSSSSDTSEYKSEPQIGERDLWFIKINHQGDIIWDKTIGGLGDDVAIDVQEVQGNYLFLAHSNSDSGADKSENAYGGYDLWIGALDQAGNLLWDKTYGGTADDFGVNIHHHNQIGTPPLNDSLIRVGANSYSDSSGNKTSPSIGMRDMWIFTINVQGDILWQETVGTSKDDLLTEISEYNAEFTNQIFLCANSDAGIEHDKIHANIGATDQWYLRSKALCHEQNDLDIFQMSGPGQNDAKIKYNYWGSSNWFSYTLFEGNQIIDQQNGTNQNTFEYDSLGPGNYNLEVWVDSPLCVRHFPFNIYGITQLKPSDNFSVQFKPNNIQVTSKQIDFQATIFGMDGRILKQTKQAKREQEIGIEELPQGIYFLNIENKLLGETYKFVKLN